MAPKASPSSARPQPDLTLILSCTFSGTRSIGVFRKLCFVDSVNFTSSVAVGFSFPLFSSAGWWILGLHEARDGCLCWGYFQLHDDNVRTSAAANVLSYFCNEPYNECIAVFCLLCSTVD